MVNQVLRDRKEIWAWRIFDKCNFFSDEKQVDFVEVLESVTYALCKDGDVDFAHFSAIFVTKNVSWYSI